MRQAIRIVVIALLLCAGSAHACRCAEKALATYFEEASVVFMARLSDAVDDDTSRTLTFELFAPAYKGDQALNQGSLFTAVTGTSSASCGIAPHAGAGYIVFAQEDNGVFRVDSCSGTRVHLPVNGDDPRGFSDVPARFVAQQLNALAGLDAMREISANAPDPQSAENDRLVGLLDLKALAHGGTVELFAAPDNSRPAVAIIDDYAALETREYSYELPGAVVFAQLPGWYRLRLVDGDFAWAAAADSGTFFPYPDIAVNRLAYLTGNWSGFVWPEAGAGLPLRDIRVNGAGRAEFPVEVHEVRQVGGFPFLRVSVLEGEPCSGDETSVRFSGWVPAYGRNGHETAWFWSRGC